MSLFPTAFKSIIISIFIAVKEAVCAPLVASRSMAVISWITCSPVLWRRTIVRRLLLFQKIYNDLKFITSIPALFK